MATCFNCGAELVWQNDFMASELGIAPDDEDLDFIVNVLECPVCGCTTECHQLSPAEYRERNENEHGDETTKQQGEGEH